MQRRDPKSFLEEVLAQVPDLSKDAKQKLLALVSEKSGTKRAGKIAAAIAGQREDDDDA
jgi:hypothetical protein